MASQLFKNNAGGVISGTLAIGGTTLNMAAGQGARFPAPTGGDYFNLTLFEKDVGGVEFNHEIVKVTARVADSLTIARDIEGIVVAAGGTSGGWAYPSAPGLNPSQVVYADLRYTAGAAANTLTKDDNLASLASAATARTNLGLGSLATQSGTFSGSSSGTNTGDQTTVTGNAGTATALQTARNIDGVAFDGTANITVIAPGTNAAASKATPVDADALPIVDSAASNTLKKVTWANVKATLKSYFDSLYGALATVNNWTRQQYFGEATLTDGATINWDLALAQVAKVTLAGNRTMAAPTNLVNGGFYSLAVIQDGTGSRTLTWNAVFKFTAGTAPTLSTAANSRDYFTFRSDGTNLYEQGRSQGVA